MSTVPNAAVFLGPLQRHTNALGETSFWDRSDDILYETISVQHPEFYIPQLPTY